MNKEHDIVLKFLDLSVRITVVLRNRINSIKMGNFQPNYGLPVTPPGNPYVDTYPPLPPLVDSNLATIRAAIMRPMPMFQPAAVGAGYDQQAAAAQELLDKATAAEAALAEAAKVAAEKAAVAAAEQAKVPAEATM